MCLAAARGVASAACTRSSSACRSCGSRGSPPASPPSGCSASPTTSSATRQDGPGLHAVAWSRARPASAGHARRVGLVVVAFAYQRSRFGRQLRATREDPAAAPTAGIYIHRQRLRAFALSGALVGLAGGLYVHLLPVEIDRSISTSRSSCSRCSSSAALGSLLGAVVGALAVGGLDSFLSAAENGVDLFGWHLNLPTDTAALAVGVLMALVLIARPSGLTGGRELSLGWLRR